MTLNEQTLNERLARGDFSVETLKSLMVRQPPPASNRRERVFRKGRRVVVKMEDDAVDDGEPPPLVEMRDTLPEGADAEAAEAEEDNRIRRTVIPPPAQQIVLDLALLDEPDPYERILTFIGHCIRVNYTYNTTLHYYKTLRAHGTFGPRKGIAKVMTPNKRAFAHRGRRHMRVVGMRDFATFFRYLHAHRSIANAPIIIASLTGLRSFEVLQFSLYTLYQLAHRSPTVAIARKQTVVPSPEAVAEGQDTNMYWVPLYTSQLLELCSWLRSTLFGREYAEYLKTGVDMRLFPIRQNTLNARVHTYYHQAVGRPAPHGFGIHSFRNMQAMVMARNRTNLQSIQDFLQHRDVRTTRSYIKADFSETAAEFDRITQLRYATVRRHLTDALEAL
jgi:Phage integrase family